MARAARATDARGAPVNRWTWLWVNLATRWNERTDRRRLLGDQLLDEIRDRWAMSPRRPSSRAGDSTSWIRVRISATCGR